MSRPDLLDGDSAPEPLLVNARTAATMLGIGMRLLWSLTNRGDISCARVGRLVRYRPEDLRAFIEERLRRSRSSIGGGR
jgi:hypothetical protein